MKFTKTKYGWRFSIGKYDSAFQFKIHHFTNFDTNGESVTRIIFDFRTPFLMEFFKCNTKMYHLPF